MSAGFWNLASRVPLADTAEVLGGVPFGAYAVVQNFNIPLQVQPQIFMFLCLVSWSQILMYHQ